MRPRCLIAVGASALLVLLLVIASAHAQTPPRCRDILGGALDVNAIKISSLGSNVLMSAQFDLPSFTTQELLGLGRSDAEAASQTSTFGILSNPGAGSGLADFTPLNIQTNFSGKASLSWRKFVAGRRRSILRNLRVSYRLLNNGIPVTGFTHVNDPNQVLNVDLLPIAPTILCKVRRGEFIVEGGVNFDLELRDLSRSGDHNVSVEVSVDAP